MIVTYQVCKTDTGTSLEHTFSGYANGLFTPCMYCYHSDGSDYLLDGRYSGQVTYRLGKTLQHWPVSNAIGKTLDKLNAYITGIKIREDKDVGFAGYGAASCHLFGCHLWYNGGVQLKLAVY